MSHRNVSPNALRTFDAAARSSSLTDAADELHVSQGMDEAAPARDCIHVAFAVEPQAFASAVAKLRAAGVVEWKANSSEGESFHFLDPDGHRLELHDGDLNSRLAAVEHRPCAGWTRFRVPFDAPDC